MRFGYTILYVPDVVAAVDFYERAFGLTRRFVAPGEVYAELETGATALAFAAEGMADANGVAVRPNRSGEPAPAIEIALVTDDPGAAFAAAVATGATAVQPVKTKPWGQQVGYVRDLNGCLIELCSPLGG